MSDVISEKQVLTEREAAQYIGMSRSFLRQARIEGNRLNRTPGPKFFKVGTKAIRYRRDRLDEWIDQFQELDHLGQLHT
ncbi:MAG: putative DNA-binding transcriptional regulator AlpA [Marinomonas primoryensis]|jgi:predicted DNA-binding transcriptional regulator AlpA